LLKSHWFQDIQGVYATKQLQYSLSMSRTGGPAGWFFLHFSFVRHRTMTARTSVHGLQVATSLFRFIEDKVLPGTGVEQRLLEGL
jgi:uncharacterized membrane protein